MPRTLDHLVATHQIANQLRASGRNIWSHRLTVVRREDASFEQNRDEFAAALEASSWFAASTKDDEFGELWQLWDEIKDAETVEHFDACLDAIYDLADEDRCWIKFEHV